jgi:hypothetical protein
MKFMMDERMQIVLFPLTNNGRVFIDGVGSGKETDMYTNIL